MSTWPLGDKAWDKTDSTKENGEWSMVNGQWENGWYKIVATTKDKYGEEVRAEKYFQTTDNRPQTTGSSEPITVNVKKQTVEPGEKIEYNIATGLIISG
ncbi:MAG: hypothetical protein WDM90_02700 [Ferruginibacter sp.]